METLEEINKDGDGSIDEEEYMGMHRDYLYRVELDGSSEYCVSLERVNFQKVRDGDGDGFLDMEEVRS